MASSEKITFAGDVNIVHCKILSSTGNLVDIKNQVSQIELNEDIFSPLISGQLTITESYDFIGELPFIGEEILQLKIKTPSFEETTANIINQDFYIYKISNRENIAHRKTLYILYFVSLEAVADINVKLSKTYSGRVDTIAHKLITDEGLTTKKSFVIEECTNQIKYISNFWSPIDNLTFLTGRALNSNQSANYLFFENRTGLNFISLDKLYALPVAQEYIFSDYSRTGTRDLTRDYKKIHDFYTGNGFDYMKRIQQGFFNSKMSSYDLVTKKYSIQKYDYDAEFDKQKHSNFPAKSFPVSSQDLIKRNNSFLISHPKYYNNFNGIGSDGSGYWLQKRLQQLQHASSFTLNIEVAGRTDITVGQRCNVLIYKNVVLTKSDAIEDHVDKTLSGVYLIAAINHIITPKEHKCHMEVIKDHLISPIGS